jgi:hypothetical protein
MKEWNSQFSGSPSGVFLDSQPAALPTPNTGHMRVDVSAKQSQPARTRLKRARRSSPWYSHTAQGTPFIKYIKEIFDCYDLVRVGGVKGPVTDASSYIDMTPFAQVYAEHPSSPMPFMGEDICGVTRTARPHDGHGGLPDEPGLGARVHRHG